MTSHRRKHTQEFKDQIVKEAIETNNAALVARQHNLATNMLYRWMLEHQNPASKKSYQSVQPKAVSNNANKSLETENLTLMKLFSEKDLQIAILEDLFLKNKPAMTDKVEIANKWIGVVYPKTTVLRILRLNCSTYYYQISKENAVKRTAPVRSISGYSYDKSSKVVSDDQIKNTLIELLKKIELHMAT